MSPSSRTRAQGSRSADLTGTTGEEWPLPGEFRLDRQADTTSAVWARTAEKGHLQVDLETERRIDHLESDLFHLEERVAQLAGARVVTIDTMAPEQLELVRPFHVNVEPCEEGFSASFVDANLMAFGETLPEAVWNLKDLIAGTLETLIEAGEESLGSGPGRQLRVLRQFMRW